MCSRAPGFKKIISSSRSAALSKINLKDWTVKIKIWNKMLVLNVLGYIIFSLRIYLDTSNHRRIDQM
jgi:hypothetical protein